jgi:hypothetical protein
LTLKRDKAPNFSACYTSKYLGGLLVGLGLGLSIILAKRRQRSAL